VHSEHLGMSIIVHGPAKSGKALALDTPLPTPTGWTTMGEVQVGDELFNDKGEIIHVAAIGPVWDDRPCRRVAVMGDVITADAAHVWQASRPKGDNLGTFALVETDQLVVSPGTFRSLPWTPVLQLPEVDLPVHPYILGCWLGDGGTTHASKLGWCDEKKLFMLQQCVDLYGSGEVRKEEDGRYTAFLPHLQTTLTQIGARVEVEGKWAKRVPAIYLRAGIDQRRDLLAGLLDTDGHIGPKVCEFTTVSEELAHAAAELGCSLGVRAHVSAPQRSRYLKDGEHVVVQDHYDVRFRGVVRSHQLSKRPDRIEVIPETRHKRYYRLQVKNVAPVPSVPVRCIQVDDLHGMFLAGRSMIPTHNSFLGDSTPAPRLILDAEMGSRFTPSRKKVWDPTKEAPPQPDGTWDTCIVFIRDYRSVLKAYEWLDSGKHPFRSVVIDSLSETQQRAIDSLAGIQQPTQQEWGTLLRQVSDLVRRFRDLTTNPVKPLDAVMFIAMTRQGRDGDNTWRPHVQGSLAVTLPYVTDVVGYLCMTAGADGVPIRRLFVGPVPGFETGERVGGRLGDCIDNPNMTEMLARVRGCSVDDVLGQDKKESK
jgi:hypothetical protein